MKNKLLILYLFVYFKNLDANMDVLTKPRLSYNKPRANEIEEKNKRTFTPDESTNKLSTEVSPDLPKRSNIRQNFIDEMLRDLKIQNPGDLNMINLGKQMVLPQADWPDVLEKMFENEIQTAMNFLSDKNALEILSLDPDLKMQLNINNENTNEAKNANGRYPEGKIPHDINKAKQINYTQKLENDTSLNNPLTSEIMLTDDIAPQLILEFLSLINPFDKNPMNDLNLNDNSDNMAKMVLDLINFSNSIDRNINGIDEIVIMPLGETQHEIISEDDATSDPNVKKNNVPDISKLLEMVFRDHQNNQDMISLLDDIKTEFGDENLLRAFVQFLKDYQNGLVELEPIDIPDEENIEATIFNSPSRFSVQINDGISSFYIPPDADVKYDRSNNVINITWSKPEDSSKNSLALFLAGNRKRYITHITLKLGKGQSVSTYEKEVFLSSMPYLKMGSIVLSKKIYLTDDVSVKFSTTGFLDDEDKSLVEPPIMLSISFALFILAVAFFIMLASGILYAKRKYNFKKKDSLEGLKESFA